MSSRPPRQCPMATVRNLKLSQLSMQHAVLLLLAAD